MSSTFFPASAASPSALSEPECTPEPSAKLTHTAAPSSPSTGQASLFSETSEISPQPASQQLWPTPHGMCVPNKRRAGPSGNELGRAVNQSLTSSAEASPVRTSAPPERVLVLQARGVDSGANTTDSLANFYPATSSWRTSQRCLVEGWSRYSETWPRSGMTRSGTAYRLPTLAPLTDGTESGSWPTPQAKMPGGGPESEKVQNLLAGSRHSFYLTHAVTASQIKPNMWPTPGAQDAKWRDTPNNIRERVEKGYQISLHGAVLLRVPTPNANDWKGSSKAGQRRGQLTDPAMGVIPQGGGGALNPTWVEWLMGFPLGWTVLEPWEMPSSRKLLK